MECSLSNHSDTKVVIGWKVTLIILGSVGLLVCLRRAPGFWSSYVLDIVGPAWNYILLRGIYTSKKSGSLFFRLKPDAAALIILAICFLIETAQYFKLYEARFDPYDYLAYVSLLLPVYLIDKYIFAGNYRPERSPAITGQGDA